MNYCKCIDKDGKPMKPMPSTVDRRNCGRCGLIIDVTRKRRNGKGK